MLGKNLMKCSSLLFSYNHWISCITHW